MAKILIAEDSNYMRKTLSDILVKIGYTELVEAEDGKQAVEMFDKEKPDLVLLDLIMPQMDGIAVLKVIMPKGARVLVVSAVGQDSMIAQARELGVKGYIVKPFEEAQVIEEVKKILA